MASVSINANVGAKLSESRFASQVVGGSGDIVAQATTVVTDLATAVTDYKIPAAAIIAITGDTFNTSTLQFTTGGGTGLTHAQWATIAAELNTFTTASLAAQTAAAAVSGSLGADVTIIVNSSTVTSANAFRSVWQKIVAQLGGLGLNFSA